MICFIQSIDSVFFFYVFVVFTENSTMHDPYFISPSLDSGPAGGGLGDILDGRTGDADGVDEGSIFRSQKDAVIFAIDSRRSMFSAPDSNATNGPPPFYTAVNAALQFAQDKGVTSEKDLAGLVLFGTKQASNAYGFPQVYVFHEMDSISLPRVVELETLARAAFAGEPMYNEFRETIGHCDDSTTSGNRRNIASAQTKINVMDEAGALATSDDRSTTAPSPLALSDLLWTLLHLFNQQSVRRTAFKRVFLFTNDDDPCRGKPLEKARAMARARDLKEHGISLDVYHWGRAPPHPLASIAGGGGVVSLTGSSDSSGDRSGNSVGSSSSSQLSNTNSTTCAIKAPEINTEKIFRVDFWAQLLTVVVNNHMPPSESQFSLHTPFLGELVPVSDFQGAEVRVRTYPLRSIASLRLGVGVGIDVPSAAVRVYLPVSKCPKRSFTWLEAATNQAITTETRYRDPATGNELSRADFHKAIPVGKVDTIKFDASEVEHIRTQVSTPGIRIVGFRPAEEAGVRPELNTGRSAFLGVDRSQASRNDAGLKFFLALYRELIRKGQVAVAEVTMRATGTPRLAVMIPATEGNSAPEAVRGCGFHLWMLPYADDLRDVKVTTACEPSTASVDAAVRVVDALTQRDVAADFAPSPAIQKQLFVLQQHVLQDSSAEPPGDKTLPDTGGMAKVAAKLFTAFNVATWGNEAGYAAEVMAPLPAPKKPEPTKAEIDSIDFDALAVTGMLASLTIPYLKAFLSQKGQSTEGRKQDLVDRVSAYILKKRVREDDSYTGDGP